MIEISRRAVLFGLFYVMIKKFDDEDKEVRDDQDWNAFAL